MTPRPPKQAPAVVVELSVHTRAIIYGRGSVILIRGGESLTMSDSEAGKLVAAHAAFVAAPAPAE